MELDGIGSAEIMQSLSVEANRHRVFRAGEGAGASGSFFFFSHDDKFIIKTMSTGERNKMLSMLEDYVSHIEETGNRSLITRIYGIFEIRTNYFEPVTLMIM